MSDSWQDLPDDSRSVDSVGESDEHMEGEPPNRDIGTEYIQGMCIYY